MRRLKYEKGKPLRYPIVIEKAKKNHSAYSPDLPGCAAMGATVKQTISRMKSAIELHLEGQKKQPDEKGFSERLSDE